MPNSPPSHYFDTIQPTWYSAAEDRAVVGVPSPHKSLHGARAMQRVSRFMAELDFRSESLPQPCVELKRRPVKGILKVAVVQQG
jgi:hypothetical protein